MGAYMLEDDIYIGTFLDLFNLRFAPTPFAPAELFGGIEEVIKLQKEFEIFRPGRQFSTSAALLGIGGLYNARAKNRWIRLLENLPDKGDQAIADAILANLNKR